MPNTLAKTFVKSKLTEAIIATLAFFDIYKLPISGRRVWELLYRVQATPEAVTLELQRLAQLGIIVFKDGMYALEDWDAKKIQANQIEIEKRWTRIRRYYWILSAVPFVEHISVINSVAMGNADHESDIDFFVVTKPERLYFVRSVIIVLFKLLGVYKNKRQINMRFCFGFYITSDSLSLKELLLPGEDPYLVFWLGTITPIFSLKYYEKLVKENRWIHSWLPNFKTMHRLEMYRRLKPSITLKKFLEVLCYPPALVLEPMLRKIHIRHTFKLPENNWNTSSTIANKTMLKLHAIDPRKELRSKWVNILQNYR
jgi:predicted nucleotidyltransferase